MITQLSMAKSGLLVLVLAVGLHTNQALMLTAEQKVETTKAHNLLRGSVYPAASNMNYLVWSNRLEDLAQRAANRCVFEHNYGGDYSGLGENLYLGGRTNVTEMVTLFYMEHLAYDYASGQCNKPNVFSFTVCGHYTQVVGATVKEVGCAIASCSSLPGNLFVCEYNAMAPSPVYSSGLGPCANCYPHGYCYGGLCVNGTQRNELIAKNETVTCALQCKNCGTLQDLSVLSPPVCMCNCPGGYTGSDCSTKSNANAPALTCSPCTQQATPCLNGGVENSTSGGSCSCSCPSNATGPQCQVVGEAYTGALHLQLRGSNTFCYRGQCIPSPNTPLTFASQVWPTLKSILVSSVNAYCRTHFTECCGSGTAVPSGGPTGDLLLASDMRYVDFSVSLSAAGDLGVAIFASSRSDNSLCTGSTGRRRRRRAVTTTSSVSSTVLEATVTSANTTISNALTSCCSMSVSSTSAYKTVVDTQYGYGSSGGGGSGSGSGGGGSGSGGGSSGSGGSGNNGASSVSVSSLTPLTLAAAAFLLLRPLP